MIGAMLGRVPIATLALALCLLSASCISVDPPRPDAPPHHRPGGFQNNHVEFEPKALTTLLRWKIGAAIDGLPPPPQRPTAQVPPDTAFIHANAGADATMQPAVTWIGHATALVQMGGLNLLTDPMFSDRASPLANIGPMRAQPPGLKLSELPRIDLVLISHNHYDHLDEASVRALSAQPGGGPLFIVPLGVKRWMNEAGIDRVVELDWWQSHRLGSVDVVMTPVQHWSGRGLIDRMSTLWAGYAVFAPDLHLYFSGDTGYSPDFVATRERFAARQTPALGGGFDIALIAIGAYQPRWFMKDQHVNPAEAVQVHLDLQAKRSMGVHWGTFALTDEALDAPPLALAEARRALGVDDDRFFVVAVGETRRLPARRPLQR